MASAQAQKSPGTLPFWYTKVELASLMVCMERHVKSKPESFGLVVLGHLRKRECDPDLFFRALTTTNPDKCPLFYHTPVEDLPLLAVDESAIGVVARWRLSLCEIAF